MKGQRSVAINEDEEVDGGPQAHDEGTADGGGVQSCLMRQQRKNAHNSQHNNDDTTCPQVPEYTNAVSMHAAKPVIWRLCQAMLTGMM